MRIQKDNKAVSPVIGIMLMLVVTVILAAAVSSTSTGLMKSSEKAPFAVFDVKVAKNISDGSDPYTAHSYITIKQITGDVIHTKDMKIITTNSRANGTTTREILPGVPKTYGQWGTSGTVPYWNNAVLGHFGGANLEANFGNYTFKPGVSMTAQDGINDNVGTWNGLNYDAGNIGQVQDMFADWNSVKKGDLVNVKILHTPSNKIIFVTDVEVI